MSDSDTRWHDEDATAASWAVDIGRRVRGLGAGWSCEAIEAVAIEIVRACREEQGVTADARHGLRGVGPDTWGEVLTLCTALAEGS